MNHRIFVEKRIGYNVEAQSLFQELLETFHLQNSLHSLRLLNIYDVFNAPEQHFGEAIELIFSEQTVDNVYKELDLKGSLYFSVEYLPGQFDQRADSSYQCLNILSESNKEVVVKSGKLILLEGELDSQMLTRIKNYYINPVEMQEKDLDKLEISPNPPPAPIPIYDGFIHFSETELRVFLKKMELAMSFADLKLIQNYFLKEERRNPSETEIKVLDTYWSDHCRHTTFETILKDIKIPSSQYTASIQLAFEDYLESRRFVYEDRAEERPLSLMDMATISAKEIRKKGKLDDLEISDEINACSIYIDVDVDGKDQKWLLMFKNETHNHPTEIEPFGGASTCIGGAIRDPLSGRSYVYQAIRVSGAANPLETIEKTLAGKLPQKKITQEAARGYSSYGNQIGVATSHVTEIYHSGYKAKRMEVGAVVGAVPAKQVRRETPQKGDLVIMFGGRTGRDGIGGATGSSKEHTTTSLTTAFAEVQKGNAPEERKIQKLFRRAEVSKLIKKSNDFGAGGVAVAVGELAEGLDIYLDKVKLKYTGLNGTELAISESQERMSVVVAPEDVNNFIQYAEEENLEAVIIAEITDNHRLTMFWKGDKIVDLSREFLDTNGVRASINVEVAAPQEETPFKVDSSLCDIKERVINTFTKLNVASQKGLVEIFDSTIGGATVLLPFGGKKQETPTDVSIHKIPVLEGKTNTISAISWGFNPEISSWSPFHGGAYAVVESMTKLVAAGIDYQNIRLSFQEYFRKMGDKPKNWGLPFAALLGAQYVMKRTDIPAIGGKDSMSGSFHNLHVPPTLISFAVASGKIQDIISPEFKQKNSYLYLLKHTPNLDFSPHIKVLKSNFAFLHQQIKKGKIRSASSLKMGGLIEALYKSSFGNEIGIDIQIEENQLFSLDYGSILIESSSKLDFDNLIYLGSTCEYEQSKINGILLPPIEIKKAWKSTLEPIFPEKAKNKKESIEVGTFKNKNIAKAKNKIAKPRVFIPAFPGTNCEYDSQKAFEQNGGITHLMTFRNLTSKQVKESIEEIVKQLKQAQILMLSGGFSAGDEPDGSGKFIAAVLHNPYVAEAIQQFLERDGLILGVCNGFQALVKSGLLPNGKVQKLSKDSPTLTFNTIGRHISRIVNTKVVSKLSPWLNNIELESIHQIAISHGEGRFVAPQNTIDKLIKNGQLAFQYVDHLGNPSMEADFNPNGSMFAIEGITSPDGRILGKMGHSERFTTGLYKNIIGNKEQAIFKSGIDYFK